MKLSQVFKTPKNLPNNPLIASYAHFIIENDYYY